MVRPSATTAKANPPRSPVPSHALRSRTRGSRVMSGDQTASPECQTVPVSPSPGRKIKARERSMNPAIAWLSTDQPSWKRSTSPSTRK